MKFSIIYEAQMVDTSRKNEAQVFQDIVEQSVYAEEMGFDVIWSVEPPQSHPICPSVGP